MSLCCSCSPPFTAALPHDMTRVGTHLRCLYHHHEYRMEAHRLARLDRPGTMRWRKAYGLSTVRWIIDRAYLNDPFLLSEP